MAVAVDTATQNVITANPQTWTHAVSGNDRLLIVLIAEWRGDSTSAITGVTYQGDALTKLDQAFNTALISVWYLVNPTITGSNIISVAGGPADGAAVAISFTGVHQSSTFGTLVKDEASNNAPSVTLTSAVGEMCVDGLACIVGSVATITGGQTAQGDITSGNAHAVGSTEAGAAGVTMSYSTTGDARRAMVGVPIKAAPAAVGISNRLLRGAGLL